MAKDSKERKTVLLIQPALRQVIKPRIPINLLPLGYTLREAGYNPIILDLRLKNFEDFDIDWNDVLMAGISTYTGPMIHSALEVSGKIRERDKFIKIVWGGIHPTLDAEPTAKHPLVDCVVRRDGEETIVELAGAFGKNKPLDRIKGITYRKGMKVVSNPERERFVLDKIPHMPYDLLDIKAYNLAEFPLNTSRGCPFRCIFCYNCNFNAKTFILKSADKVLDEIEYIKKQFPDVKEIAFSDDNFFMDKGRAEAICRGMLERKINLKWMSTIRANYLTSYSDEFLKIIKESGGETLAFGAESGNDRILGIIGKGTSVATNLGAVRQLKKAGIKGRISFVWGIPGETYEESIDSLNMIKEFEKISPESIVNGFFIATVYPHTPLFDTVRKIVPDFRMPKTLEEWADWELYTSGYQPWLDKAYVDRMTTASEIVRFKFLHRMNPANYFSNPLIVLGIRIGEAVMSISARIRWKYHFYKWGYEWKLFNRLRYKIMGLT